MLGAKGRLVMFEWLQDAILSAQEKDAQEARRKLLVSLGGCPCGSGAIAGECPEMACGGPLQARAVHEERIRDLELAIKKAGV